MIPQHYLNRAPTAIEHPDVKVPFVFIPRSCDPAKTLSGLRSRCRKCEAERATLYRALNREKVRDSRNRWAAANPDSMRLKRRRNYLKHRPCRIRAERTRKLRRYGVTQVDVDNMLKRQRNRCAICRHKFGEGQFKRSTVDHCHATGVVRGILCGKCNIALGAFADDVGRLQAAIRYLEAVR